MKFWDMMDFHYGKSRENENEACRKLQLYWIDKMKFCYKKLFVGSFDLTNS
jgi:hypothetical protein